MIGAVGLVLCFAAGWLIHDRPKLAMCVAIVGTALWATWMHG